MTDEQVKKEFGRWTDAGKPNIWVRHERATVWDKVHSPLWRTPNTIYVIDDEYADVRKAYYDGKRVEWRCESEQEWYPVTTDNFYKPVDKYRIKPEEPIYEWQWYALDEEGGYYLSGFNTEDEVTDKDTWEKFEPSKRERK